MTNRNPNRGRRTSPREGRYRDIRAPQAGAAIGRFRAVWVGGLSRGPDVLLSVQPRPRDGGGTGGEERIRHRDSDGRAVVSIWDRVRGYPLAIAGGGPWRKAHVRPVRFCARGVAADAVLALAGVRHRLDGPRWSDRHRRTIGEEG